MRGFFIHHRSSSHPSESTPLRRKLQPLSCRDVIFTRLLSSTMAHGLDHPSNFFVLRVFVVAVAARSSLWRIWALALALRISPFSLTLIVIVREPLAEGERCAEIRLQGCIRFQACGETDAYLSRPKSCLSRISYLYSLT